MSWHIDDSDRIGFACDKPKCPQTVTAPPHGLLEAFLYARANGWHAVLNEQLCPIHARRVSK